MSRAVTIIAGRGISQDALRSHAPTNLCQREGESREEVSLANRLLIPPSSTVLLQTEFLNGLVSFYSPETNRGHRREKLALRPLTLFPNYREKFLNSKVG
jgi:hypothetical protein